MRDVLHVLAGRVEAGSVGDTVDDDEGVSPLQVAGRVTVLLPADTHVQNTESEGCNQDTLSQNNLQFICSVLCYSSGDIK